MHILTFSVTQYGMLSFPPTTGMNADCMGMEVITKTHAIKCDAVKHFPLGIKMLFQDKNYIILNMHTFPLKQNFVQYVDCLGVKWQCIDF